MGIAEVMHQAMQAFPPTEEHKEPALQAAIPEQTHKISQRRPRNVGAIHSQRPPPTLFLLALGLPSRNRSVQRQQPAINGDDDAHYECDCGPPYRTADSPFSTPAHLGARSMSCAKPLVARDCPLAYSISQEKA